MKINEVVATALADPRTQATNIWAMPKIIRTLEENCSDAIQAMREDKFIYKGFGNSRGNFLLTDPTLKERKSANTTNQYTLLLDNLPAWKEYPNRSKSLICTTSSSVAETYGETYLVVPFNGAKIGVCPDEDVWYSFPVIDKRYKFGDLATVNEELRSVGVSDQSYEVLISGCLSSHNTKLNHYSGDSLFLKELQLADTPADVVNFFNGILSPALNKFKLTNVKGIPSTDSSHEVWTDSKAYLIEVGDELCANILDHFKVWI